MFGNRICIRVSAVLIMDETIWRYIDTISIRRATIRIVPWRDISRYNPDIRDQEKSLRFHCSFSIQVYCFGKVSFSDS